MIFGGGRNAGIESTLYDYLLVYPFWAFVMIVTQSLIFILPVDLIRLVLYLIFRNRREKIFSIVSKIFTVLIILTVIYVPARIIYDYNTVETRISKTYINNLPEDLEGFRIALVADTQADRYTDKARLDNFIEKVNNTNPDLVLVAGDIITSTPDYINIAAEELGKIKSKNGIYACYGDHDNWAYREDLLRSQKEIREALNNNGIPIYNNENKILRFGSAKVKITFATYTYSTRISAEEINALAENNSANDLNIFLIHQPSEAIVKIAGEKGYDLFFSGHTHGGQITLLFPFVRLSPTLLETQYVRGDYFYDDMKIVVTPGLGMSIAPIRYNSTPEVTVIELHNKN